MDIVGSIIEIKNLVANGKELIGGVVGGNQNSTFQMLANNAQSIKTARDNNASQISSLNSQVSSLNSQISSVTTDRNNWKNIANSRTIYGSSIVSVGSSINVNIPRIKGNSFCFQNELGSLIAITVFDKWIKGICSKGATSNSFMIGWDSYNIVAGTYNLSSFFGTSTGDLSGTITVPVSGNIVINIKSIGSKAVYSSYIKQ